MSFWHTATDTQKLAQIKAAIELGMDAEQCAMNLGAESRKAIHAFCRSKGFWYGMGEEARRKRRKNVDVGIFLNAKGAIERNGFDPSNSELAPIFDRHYETNLFDPLPYDGEAFQ